LHGNYEAWCVDAHGLRQGIGRRYDEDGRLFFEATFKDDKADGLTTDYHKNGAVKSLSMWRDDEPDGPWTEYDEHGALEAQERYVAGQRRETIVWDHGRPVWQQKYRDGTEDGLYRTWYENGKIRREGNFRDGTFDGVVLGYDERGVLSGVQRWKNGKAVPKEEVRAELERALEAERERSAGAEGDD